MLRESLETAILRAQVRLLNPAVADFAIEQISRLFASLVSQLTAILRDTVPVRTGLMRRRVQSRNIGRTASEISSTVRYAPYVRRYDQAMDNLERRATQEIRRGVIRYSLYEVVGNQIKPQRRYVKTDKFITVRRSGVRIVLRLRVPSRRDLLR